MSICLVEFFDQSGNVQGSKEFEAKNIKDAIKQIENEILDKAFISCEPNAMAKYYSVIRTSSIARFRINTL